MSSGRKCLQPLDLQLHGQRQCLPKQVNLHFHFGQIFFKLGQIHLSNYAKYMLTMYTASGKHTGCHSVFAIAIWTNILSNYDKYMLTIRPTGMFTQRTGCRSKFVIVNIFSNWDKYTLIRLTRPVGMFPHRSGCHCPASENIEYTQMRIKSNNLRSNQNAARTSTLSWSWGGWRRALAHKGHHHVDHVHHVHHHHHHLCSSIGHQNSHRMIQIWGPHSVASYGHLHRNGSNRNLWKHSRLPRDSQVVRIKKM